MSLNLKLAVKEGGFALLKTLNLCVYVCVVETTFQSLHLTSSGKRVLVCTDCNVNQGETHKSTHLYVVSLRSSLHLTLAQFNQTIKL